MDWTVLPAHSCETVAVEGCKCSWDQCQLAHVPTILRCVNAPSPSPGNLPLAGAAMHYMVDPIFARGLEKEGVRPTDAEVLGWHMFEFSRNSFRDCGSSVGGEASHP